MASLTIAPNRNQAIAAVLCKHLSVDPVSISTDDTGESDLASLFSNIIAACKVPLENESEVMKWATFASNFPHSRDAERLATVKDLNEDLAQKSVLLGDGLKPSVADILVFCALHIFVSHLPNENLQSTFTNVARWMDYIQNIEDFAGVFDKIVLNKPEFDFVGKLSADDNALESTKNKKDTKEKKKLPEKESMKGKKDTEEKKKQPEKENTEKETEVSITILNIQVGVIRRAWKHPSADSLLVEEIDIGEGNLRQVVSGLAKYYSPDDLANRRVVLITNVKPGKLRDVMSSGLVLCASSQDHTVVEPLMPPEGTVPGERVSFSGFDGKPEDVLNPKKKQLEKITPHLITDDKGVATYKGIPFMTSAGPCVSSIAKATIK